MYWKMRRITFGWILLMFVFGLACALPMAQQSSQSKLVSTPKLTATSENTVTPTIVMPTTDPTQAPELSQMTDFIFRAVDENRQVIDEYHQFLPIKLPIMEQWRKINGYLPPCGECVAEQNNLNILIDGQIVDQELHFLEEKISGYQLREIVIDNPADGLLVRTKFMYWWESTDNMRIQWIIEFYYEL